MDPIDVHILDAGLRFVAALPHVFVANRVEPVLLARLAGDGVQTDVVVRPSLEPPHVAALGVTEILRAGFLPPGGETVLPHGRMLDHMIVDRNDLDMIRKRHRSGLVESSHQLPTS
jgi:hypothetical protein